MKNMPFRKKQLGIILLSTISFLALIASFILSSMQGIILYRKSSNQLIDKHQVLNDMERQVNQLLFSYKKFAKNSACLINEKQPNQVIQLLKNKQGCLVIQNEKQYFYLIEKLGSYPCIQSNFENGKYGTRHYRFTLFYPDKGTLLQLRIASLESVSTCDKQRITTVLPGILSWRYLTI